MMEFIVNMLMQLMCSSICFLQFLNKFECICKYANAANLRRVCRCVFIYVFKYANVANWRGVFFCFFLYANVAILRHVDVCFLFKRP